MKSRVLLDTIGDKHPVYRSICLLVKKLAVPFGLTYRFFLGRLWVLNLPNRSPRWYQSPPALKDSIYVTKSPFICLESWECLMRKRPLIVAEEFLGNPKTGGFGKRVLGFFREIPFIAQTKRTRDFLLAAGVRNVFFVPPTEIKGQGSKNRVSILFVGRLIPSKNPSLFLKLAARFPGEKFVMVGDGELYPRVAEEAKQRPNFTLIRHFQHRVELLAQYGKSKLLIHPAFKDPIGFVIVEALSRQTPVIASKGTGASDFLPADWAVEDFDESKWAARIEKILKKQDESVAFAGQLFEKEHLNQADPYFTEIAEELGSVIRKKWPHLILK
jgi:glycosyltransferase involved in cell wall biosynthesis